MKTQEYRSDIQSSTGIFKMCQFRVTFEPKILKFTKAYFFALPDTNHLG